MRNRILADRDEEDARRRQQSSDGDRSTEGARDGADEDQLSVAQRRHGNQAVAQVVGDAQRQTGKGGSKDSATDEKTKPKEPDVDVVSSKTETRECTPAEKRMASTHLSKADSWRKQSATKLNAFLRLLERRARRTQAGSAVGGKRRTRQLGSEVTAELNELHPHFGIGDTITKRVNDAVPTQLVDWPLDPSTELPGQGYEALRNTAALVQIRNRFRDVSTSHSVSCGVTPPDSAEGADVFGQAVAGSGRITIFPGNLMGQSARTKTATMLHESFHASFAGFDHDSYSMNSDYPGSSPLTNADSYATYASIVATGSSFRIKSLGPTTITAPNTQSDK